MINDFSTSKALLDKLRELSYDVAVQGGDTFNPGDDAYLKEFDMKAGEERIGMANTDSKLGKGVYQVDVCTPKGNGKWPNLKIVEEVKGHFTMGLVLTHDSQSLTIYNSSSSRLRIEGDWLITSVSIYYSVIG